LFPILRTFQSAGQSWNIPTSPAVASISVSSFWNRMRFIYLALYFDLPTMYYVIIVLSCIPVLSCSGFAAICFSVL
jgi:hypothetical protein